ncbi:MAG: restriction endonuclease subunit S [Nitrospira sp.]|nr:restriction endonuclease subunit S [Nitrospira sp.]
MSSKKKTTDTKEDAKPALVPKLRFPEFRGVEGWQQKSLGGLCRIRTGKKDANEGAVDGAYPFFTCAEKHIYSHNYSFDAEAILIAGNANVGQTSYYNGKFEAYQRTYVLTDFKGIFVPYLYSVLSANLRPDLLAQVQISAMSYIRLPMLEEYQINAPSSQAEQHKIAECLSSVDEVIAAQARKVDALKTHRKGLMQQLFPREGETQPRLRLPEFKNAGEWERTTIGELNPFVTSGSRGWAAFYADKGELFVRITNLWRDSIYLDLTDSKFVQLPPGANEGVRTQLKEHDVLISITADIGIVGYVDKSVPSPAYINQHIALVRFVEGQLCGKFVAYFLASEESQRLFRASTDNGAKAGMNLIGIQKIGLMLPSVPEQHRIANCLSSLDTLITAETQKFEALKRHKRGLMQQLFPSPEEVAG